MAVYKIWTSPNVVGPIDCARRMKFNTVWHKLLSVSCLENFTLLSPTSNKQHAVLCSWSFVGILHKWNWPPRNNWHIVESGVNTNTPPHVFICLYSCDVESCHPSNSLDIEILHFTNHDYIRFITTAYNYLFYGRHDMTEILMRVWC